MQGCATCCAGPDQNMAASDSLCPLKRAHTFLSVPFLKARGPPTFCAPSPCGNHRKSRRAIGQQLHTFGNPIFFSSTSARAPEFCTLESSAISSEEDPSPLREEELLRAEKSWGNEREIPFPSPFPCCGQLRKPSLHLRWKSASDLRAFDAHCWDADFRCVLAPPLRITVGGVTLPSRW